MVSKSHKVIPDMRTPVLGGIISRKVAWDMQRVVCHSFLEDKTASNPQAAREILEMLGLDRKLPAEDDDDPDRVRVEDGMGSVSLLFGRTVDRMVSPRNYHPTAHHESIPGRRVLR